jgi:hypothetical protein
MKQLIRSALIALLLLTACAKAASVSLSGSISVQYTFASTAWLTALYGCAGNAELHTDLRAADYLDPQQVDLVIRIGQPDHLTSPAYQIGTEDLLVIVNRKNPASRLTAAQVRGLFTGQVRNWKDVGGSDAPVQAWVFPAGEDVEQLFEQNALSGAPVSPEARLATSPDEMAQAVAANANAVGILPRHWKAGNVTDAYNVVNAPVLAIVSSQPEGVTAQLVACLQK